MPRSYTTSTVDRLQCFFDDHTPVRTAFTVSKKLERACVVNAAAAAAALETRARPSLRGLYVMLPR